jgi:hypothetical protein
VILPSKFTRDRTIFFLKNGIAKPFSTAGVVVIDKRQRNCQLAGIRQ